VSRLRASCCVASALTACTTACSGSHHGSSQRSGDLTGTITAVLKQTPGGPGLHIYDAQRMAKATVTSGDIVRSSIRVVPLSRRYATLYVGFNRRGRAQFCRLCGVSGFESDRMPIRAARAFAKLIRNR
jgi:hypothetical protein